MTRTIRVIISLLLTLLLPHIAWSGTLYHICWDTGDDANSGTTVASPWQRHPFMKGFTGTYIAAPGDSFVFRGGVTWPNSAFPMTIRQGGTAEMKARYTVDRSWHDGEHWVRPVFDLENVPTEGSYVVQLVGTAHVDLDSLEIRRQHIAAGQEFNRGGIAVANAQDITVSNLFVHSWTLGTTKDNFFGGITALNSDVSVYNSSIQGASIGSSGSGIVGCNIVSHCVVQDVPVGIKNGIRVSDNHVFNIRSSFDPSRHEVAMYILGSSGITNLVYNNVIHDVQAGTGYELTACWNEATGVIKFYNNVAYNLSVLPINIINEQGTPGGVAGEYWIFNNFIVGGNSTLFFSPRPTSAIIKRAHVVNNVFVAIGTFPSHIYSEQPIESLVIDHNLYLHPAGADYVLRFGNTRHTFLESQLQGHNSASIAAIGEWTGDWRPSAMTDPVVDTGTTVIGDVNYDRLGTVRPQGASWDIGPYEYTSANAGRPRVDERLLNR